MIEKTLDKAWRGERIGRGEAESLFEADLLLLGMIADRVCRERHPEPFRTYVIDRNINYTNICTSGCRFCAFFRTDGDPDGYVLSVEEVLRKVGEAVDLGATQILMQGGLHPTLPLEWYEELVRAIKAKYPVHMHSFSPPEIMHLSKISGLPMPEVLARLKAAGLDSVPGGGAEVLSEGVRSQVSPNKCSTSQWFEVMREAHRQGMPTTATMMFGHLDSRADRIDHLLRLREVQDESGGFTAFIPWTFQPGNTDLAALGEDKGAVEYLRTLAISRIVLDNFQNLQASWVTQGSKIAQLALRFGANDLGGTMIEENVVRAAGCSFRLGESEIRRMITDAGYRPRRRDTYYRLLE